ncbi:MAG TPA: hypothetical protein VJ770_29085, partial [Stellaceae bacterium]|nr:hypothetical protein [Stellaceae bacterium]
EPAQRDHRLGRTPRFGVGKLARVSPVSVGPGAIALTRMPCAARSTAIACSHSASKTIFTFSAAVNLRLIFLA